MNITLYRYLGERNKIDKSGDLVFVLRTSGKFKGEVSILAPSLVLSLPISDGETITDENGNRIADVVLSEGETPRVLNFNYFYIQEFGRHYYLTGLAVSSGNVAFLTGEVDPLYSFAPSIKANSAMIERNEFLYDPLQEDSALPLELEKEITEMTPAAGSLVNTEFKSDFDLETAPQPHLFTISIASVGGKESDISALGNLPAISTGQAGDVGGQVVMTLNRDNVLILIAALMGSYSSYATFFKSLTVYPFELDEASNLNVAVEAYKAEDDGQGGTIFTPIDTGAQGRYIQSISKYRVVADFVIPSASSFLDMNPYSHYELYLPFYGWHELDYNDIAGDRLTVFYSVNYENGSGEVYIYDYTDQRLLFSASVQVGIALSLSSSNAQELQAQKNAAQLNLILGLVGSGVGMLGSAVTGNPFGVANSGLSAVSAVTGYVNQTSMMFQKAQSTHNGPAGALYAPLEVRLRITRAQARNGLNLADFAHQFGRPLRQVRRLGDLSGFTQIAKIHLDNLEALDREKQEIESSLIEGVIL